MMQAQVSLTLPLGILSFNNSFFCLLAPLPVYLKSASTSHDASQGQCPRISRIQNMTSYATLQAARKKKEEEDALKPKGSVMQDMMCEDTEKWKKEKAAEKERQAVCATLDAIFLQICML